MPRSGAAGERVEAREALYAELRRQPGFSRFAPATLHAAWWTFRALSVTRRELKAHGLQAKVPPPPQLPWGSRTGVNGVLARTDPTCLERALVLQIWLRSHGVCQDVVIGVRSREDGDVAAHAWVDGYTPTGDLGCYREIHRLTCAA